MQRPHQPLPQSCCSARAGVVLLAGPSSGGPAAAALEGPLHSKEALPERPLTVLGQPCVMTKQDRLQLQLQRHF